MPINPCVKGDSGLRCPRWVQACRWWTKLAGCRGAVHTVMQLQATPHKLVPSGDWRGSTHPAFRPEATSFLPWAPDSRTDAAVFSRRGSKDFPSQDSRGPPPQLDHLAAQPPGSDLPALARASPSPHHSETPAGRCQGALGALVTKSDLELEAGAFCLEQGVVCAL